MDKTDRLRDYGLAFLLYEHGLGVCGYELIRELFIFIKLILNSYLLLHDSCDSSSLTWAIIDVNSLSRGIYYLYLNVNGAVYRGEIQIK